MALAHSKPTQEREGHSEYGDPAKMKWLCGIGGNKRKRKRKQAVFDAFEPASVAASTICLRVSFGERRIVEREFWR
jgi:hypothetical protein